MNYADNQKKFVVIANRSVAPERLLNATAHCCGGLAEKIGEAAEFLEYPSPVGEWTAKISRYPVIILSAKNSRSIERFIRETKDSSIAVNCFTAAMLGESACQQQLQVAEDDAPEYWVVAAFGEESLLREHTRRFSLYRAN